MLKDIEKERMFALLLAITRSFYRCLYYKLFIHNQYILNKNRAIGRIRARKINYFPRLASSMNIFEQADLTPLHTFGIPTRTRRLIVIESQHDLQSAYGFGFLTEGKLERKKIAVLAGGSNVFFTRDFEGSVILIRIGGIQTEHPYNNPDILEVTFGAGLNWDESIQPFIEAGWGGGLENLSGIPGSVGAAPIQNIGAYGVEQERCFVFLRGLDTRNGQLMTFNKEECGFGYRDSIFKKELKGKFIITEVCYRFEKNAPLVLDYGQVAEEVKKRSAEPTPSTVREAVIAIRQSKLPDPKVLPNAGSFFKNPIVSEEVYQSLADRLEPAWVHRLPSGEYKISAGGLIEGCGLKGVRDGNVGTYEKQALVIVRYGEANGKDVGYFSELIARKVYETFRIRLEREVNRMN